MANHVLLPNQVRTKGRYNINAAVSVPLGINSASVPVTPLNPVSGQSCTVGRYKRWDEGVVDDDGLNMVFRGGVTFSLVELATKLKKHAPKNPAHIERAKLHFSLLNGMLQTGDYDSPVHHIHTTPSSLQTLSLWKTMGTFDDIDLFNENHYLSFADTVGGDTRTPFIGFDGLSQSPPMNYHMEHVAFPNPKLPPIHVPGKPRVNGQLTARDVLAYRIHPWGHSPRGEYWVDVTNAVATNLDFLTKGYGFGLAPPAYLRHIGFVLGTADQDIGDPDRDITSILLSLYGDFKLAVYA